MDYVKEIKESIKVFDTCTVPRCNWCPTCQDQFKFIKQLAHMGEKDQIEKGKPIKDNFNKKKDNLE